MKLVVEHPPDGRGALSSASDTTTNTSGWTPASPKTPLRKLTGITTLAVVIEANGRRPPAAFQKLSPEDLARRQARPRLTRTRP